MRWSRLLLVSLGALVLAAPGCGTMLALRDAAAGLLHLQFKLDDVQPGTLAGVNLAKVSDPASVSPLDGLKLTQAFLEGSWPLTFVVDVAVKNPWKTQWPIRIPTRLRGIETIMMSGVRRSWNHPAISM